MPLLHGFPKMKFRLRRDSPGEFLHSLPRFQAEICKLADFQQDSEIYFRPNTSFSRAVVCAAGSLRIFFSSSPSM